MEPKGKDHRHGEPERSAPDEAELKEDKQEGLASNSNHGHAESRGNPWTSIRRGIEYCGEHPFATGLLALLGLGGLFLGIADFQFSREEAKTTTEQVNRVEARVEELSERVGSTYRGGVFLLEEPVEGIYYNEWWAHPISSDEEISKFNQAEMTIRGEGKTIDFAGVLSMNCTNGRYLWMGTHNFIDPISEEKTKRLVPLQVTRNAYRLFCNR